MYPRCPTIIGTKSSTRSMTCARNVRPILLLYDVPKLLIQFALLLLLLGFFRSSFFGDCSRAGRLKFFLREQMLRNEQRSLSVLLCSPVLRNVWITKNIELLKY